MNEGTIGAVNYVFKLFLKSFFSFFSDWYFVFPKLFLRKFLVFLRDLDRSMAFRSMATHWLSPMYQDYTIPGYCIGVVIRTGWIIFDLFFYLLITILFFGFFGAWLLAPLLICWLILSNLFYG